MGPTETPLKLKVFQIKNSLFTYKEIRDGTPCRGGTAYRALATRFSERLQFNRVIMQRPSSGLHTGCPSPLRSSAIAVNDESSKQKQ